MSSLFSGKDEYVKNTASESEHRSRQGTYGTYYHNVANNKQGPDLSACNIVIHRNITIDLPKGHLMYLTLILDCPP